VQAAVDTTNKHERAEPADSTQHDEEEVADDCHVAKIERALQEAAHLWPVVEVKERVAVDEQTSGAAVEERVPPPSIILHTELEVRECNGNASSDDQQDDEHEAQNTKQLIWASTPHAVEDVEQLNVDCAERQESSHQHLIWQFTVPRNRWDFSREILSAHRSVEWSGESFARNATNEREGQTDKHPNGEHWKNSSEGQSGGYPIIGSNNVEEDDHAKYRQAKNSRSEQHDPRPLSLSGAGTTGGLHADIEACRYEASNAGGECVQHNGRDLQCPVVTRVINAHHGEEQREHRHRNELGTHTNECTQPELRTKVISFGLNDTASTSPSTHFVGREAERIAVN